MFVDGVEWFITVYKGLILGVQCGRPVMLPTTQRFAMDLDSSCNRRIVSFVLGRENFPIFDLLMLFDTRRSIAWCSRFDHTTFGITGMDISRANTVQNFIDV